RQVGEGMNDCARAFDREAPGQCEQGRRHDRPNVADDERDAAQDRRLAPVTGARQVIAELEQPRQRPHREVPDDVHAGLDAAGASARAVTCSYGNSNVTVAVSWCRTSRNWKRVAYRSLSRAWVFCTSGSRSGRTEARSVRAEHPMSTLTRSRCRSVRIVISADAPDWLTMTAIA